MILGMTNCVLCESNFVWENFFSEENRLVPQWLLNIQCDFFIAKYSCLTCNHEVTVAFHNMIKNPSDSNLGQAKDTANLNQDILRKM